MRTSSAIVSCLVVIMLGLGSAPLHVHAEGRRGAKPKVAAAAGPSAEAKEAARAAYTRGQADFAAGRFESAKTAFEEAFAAIPNPIVLLSIAEAEAKLGAIEAAISTLERYLALRADAPDKAEVQAKIRTLAATPAQVSVSSMPAGAELELDGLPTQKRTPATLQVSAGDHELAYSLSGYQSGNTALHVKAGEAHDLELRLELTSPAPIASESDSQPAPAAESSGPPATALWITGGVGAAGLITGTVFGFLAIKEHSKFESHPTEASADRGERLALFADVGFGVGAMAIVTAAVLYLTYDDSDSASADSAHKARPQLAFTPQLSPTSASASARLQF